MKQRMLYQVAPVAIMLCVAVGGCTAPSPGTSHRPGGLDKSCFSTSFITGYEAVSDKVINVEVGVNDQYALTLSGARCEHVDWANRLAIETFGTSTLCVGDDDSQSSIAFRDPASQRRIECRVDDVQRVEPKPKS